MSLYYEAASFVTDTNAASSSLKTRVYGQKELKSKPAQVFALVSEASKWSPILKDVIEKSQLLIHERKLSPSLALLLVHDLLLAKKGVSAPAAHPLRLSIEKHKARLQAEFTKARIRLRLPTLEALRGYVEDLNNSHGGSVHDETASGPRRWPHPRWIRINTIKTSLDEQLKTTFATYQHVESLVEILRASSRDFVVHVDHHIPNLVAIPAGHDPTTWLAYSNGELILQDKASCFPAYLLDPRPGDGGIVDACAAPGNKTTHLASTVHSYATSSTGEEAIYACERDQKRAEILNKMIDVAGAAELVTVLAGQDFLRIDPTLDRWSKVGALLLDPSCSGSGIVGRDEGSKPILLPSRDAVVEPQSSNRGSRKRKRKATEKAPDSKTPTIKDAEVVEEIPIPIEDSSLLQTRLEALSGFQTKLLLHAFSFPNARKVTYSTCSIHNEENEGVVLRALSSPIAEKQGWEMLKREQQVSGMRAWERRGRVEACGSSLDAQRIADGCIRCAKHTEDGTQGFFVAAFTRDPTSLGNCGHHTAEVVVDNGEEEWSGLD